MKEWAKDLNRLYSEDMQMTNKNMEGYLPSLVIREIQIKTTILCTKHFLECLQLRTLGLLPPY